MEGDGGRVAGKRRSCRRTAFLYWAYVGTIAVHHRRKDDARAAALADGVCRVQPRAVPPLPLFGRRTRDLWQRNESHALRQRLERVLRATARTIAAAPV